ncbi:MAG: hypothetical protein ABL888_02970 [Pirellulaceae bacterium]
MKLLLRRNQKPAMVMGSPTFTLEVRAELTPEEKADIEKYKLGNTLLYVRNPNVPDVDGGTLGGLASMIKWRITNLTVSVKDLLQGKRIDCKDIMEMLGAEDQIKEAAQNFKAVLRAAAGFGGEEVVAIQ